MIRPAKPQRRRHLVLTDESARHPFRASLPPHVLAGTVPVAMPRRARFDADDLRSFLLAYTAAFSATFLYLL